MFLQVDTSFTFCLAAIKKPRGDAATIHPSAARCAAHRFPSRGPAPPLCDSGERAAAFPFSSVSTKKPMQEEAKVGQQQQQPQCFHHSSSSCPDVLQSHLPAWGTSLTPSCCPTTPGAPLSFRPRAAACALCAFSEIFKRHPEVTECFYITQYRFAT